MRTLLSTHVVGVGTEAGWGGEVMLLINQLHCCMCDTYWMKWNGWDVM